MSNCGAAARYVAAPPLMALSLTLGMPLIASMECPSVLNFGTQLSQP